MIRVLIVDDHPVVRAGLRHLLGAQTGITIAAEAANHEETLAAVCASQCDLVVLDVAMPGRSGLETLAALKERWPALPVLVLSVHPAEQFGMVVLRSGGAGYLRKDSAGEQLAEAVRKAASGGRYVSPELGEVMAQTMLGRGGEPHEALSVRELEVLRQIAQGLSNPEIAAGLSISPKTVTTYRSRLLKKLGLRSNAEIARYAARHDLI
jgi:DNA-binding NarL/FixJ family response regulator